MFTPAFIVFLELVSNGKTENVDVFLFWFVVLSLLSITLPWSVNVEFESAAVISAV